MFTTKTLNTAIQLENLYAALQQGVDIYHGAYTEVVSSIPNRFKSDSYTAQAATNLLQIAGYLEAYITARNIASDRCFTYKSDPVTQNTEKLWEGLLSEFHTRLMSTSKWGSAMAISKHAEQEAWVRIHKNLGKMADSGELP